jgi:glycosyltransferase involved in cell wall biosynthesis
MQIYFDNIIFNLQKAGGISVYWMEMILRVSRQSKFSPAYIEVEHESKNIFRKILTIKNSKITLKAINIPFVTRYFPVKLEVKDALFIFHSSYLRFCKSKNAINIATIYDCTYELYGSGLSRIVHIFQKKYLLKRADLVICISTNTKNDLLRLYPTIEEKKLKVVHLAAGDDFYPIQKNLKFVDRSGVLNSHKYIIFVGSRANYKKFDLVLDALFLMKEYSLLVVGGGDMSLFEINRIESISNRVKHIKSPSVEELNIYYNNALCLLYPSQYEGFGIPILEAMKSGCPVIATHSSSVPEVAGKAALLMKEVSAKQIVKQVKKLENLEFRRKMIQLGLAQSRRFSWDRCFKETMGVYDKAINNRLRDDTLKSKLI